MPPESTRQTKKWWIAFFGWTTLIFVLNSIPGNHLPSAGSSGADYVIRQAGHVLLHGMLFVFAWKAAGTFLERAEFFALLPAVALCFLTEAYQGLIPGRNPNWEDVVYNLASVVLAFLWVSLFVSPGIRDPKDNLEFGTPSSDFSTPPFSRPSSAEISSNAINDLNDPDK
jgi:hypothetical protein